MCVCVCVCVCVLFRAACAAYGISQSRGRIRAAAVTYTTSHGNIKYFTHWARPGIEPASSWILVWFITAEPQKELWNLWKFLKHRRKLDSSRAIKQSWKCGKNRYAKVFCLVFFQSYLFFIYFYVPNKLFFSYYTAWWPSYTYMYALFFLTLSCSIISD